MFEYCEFDEVADRIASDIPARDSMSMREALEITRATIGDEAQPIIVGVALALWRSYQ